MTTAVVVGLSYSMARAQEVSEQFWSLATSAVTGPSGESLYSDYKLLQEFERELTRMPWDDDGSDLTQPWLRPGQTTDALLETAGLMDYIEARTAQDMGVFTDALIGSHAQGYSSGARDSDRAAIGTEIVASNIKLLAFPAAAGGEFLNRVESAGKMWVAGALRDNVLAPKTLKAYSDALNEDAINALEEAQRAQLEKGANFLANLYRLENSSENSADGSTSANAPAQNLVEDIRSISRADDLNEISQKLEAGVYGESREEKDEFKELIDSAKEFVASASDVTKTANEVAELLDAAGVKMPEPAAKALNFANFATDAATQLANGNFLGAATSVFKFFGPKRPSADELRHRAIMGALNRIDRKLDVVLKNQARLLEGQARIMKQLDRMQWTMESGFQNLEASLQESTILILRAIFAGDDRALAVCSSVSDAINPVLFPESAESIDLFVEPNRAGLPQRVRDSWIENPPPVSEKLNYISNRYGRDLGRCYVALSDLFNSLQGGRPIDEYFFMNRLADDLDLEKAVPGNITAEQQQDAERTTVLAKSFRDNLFGPVVTGYYLPRMTELLEAEQGLSTSDAEKAAVALAFSPPLVTQFSVVEGTTDINAPEAQRSRLVRDHFEARSALEKYFTIAIYDEISRPLSAPSVLYASGSVGDLHSIFGLMGKRPEQFTMQDDGEVIGGLAHSEEDALRLLIQALQVVEILRAQQAMIDGTSLVELLWRDLHSQDEKRWQHAQTVLSTSSLIRENFARYALFRAATDNERNSPTQYRVALAGGNRSQVETYLDRAFGDRLRIQVDCIGEATTARFCDRTLGNRYQTNFLLKISWSSDVPEAAPLFVTRLPGFLELESRAYLRSETSQSVRTEHDRLRKEVASYRMEDAINSALVADEVRDLVPNIIALYKYSRNLQRGHQRPRIELQ